MRRDREILQRATHGGQTCDGDHSALQQISECGRDEECPKVDEENNCKLGDWEEWSDCNKNGQRTRKKIIVQEEKNGGTCQEGNKIETIGCKPPAGTFYVCEFEDWKDWSECSKACGVGGSQIRLRELKLQERNASTNH